jgi:DNA-binding PadR family transcriptional regulator
MSNDISTDRVASAAWEDIVHHECNPAFGFWMGGRHGWGGWGRRGRTARDFGFFASRFGEPGPRAERGGVKYLLLDALKDAPRHGYEIMQVIEERSRGAYRPSPGVVYPTLELLAETGLVRVSEKEGRKVYDITEAGRKELQANADVVTDFYEQQNGTAWDEYADELGEFSRRLVGLVRTVHRAARHGRLDRKAVRELKKILDETIARVEGVLERDRG